MHRARSDSRSDVRRIVGLVPPLVIALVMLPLARGEERPVSAGSRPGAASPTSAVDETSLDVQLVRTGLYLITGGGGNSLLRFTANGLVLVDGKAPGTYRALMKQVRKVSKLSDLPVRALVLTDHDATHSGNCAQFAQAGIPVIAQKHVEPRLAGVHTAGPKPLRTITFDQSFPLRLGGVEMQLLHFGSAHTDGDTVVYFPYLKVVAVGELFTPGAPQPDYANGGSLLNWGQVLARVLELDFDLAVPSSGPPVGRGELQAFKAHLDNYVARASSLVREGVPKEQVLARLDAAEPGWRLPLTAEQFDRFYAELADQR